jgi:hypothetical protein
VNLTGAEAAREAAIQLEVLARELAERNFETRVAYVGETSNLSVVNAAVPSSRETITVAPADDGVWWFCWSWGDRIARITDVGTAAFKVAYLLIPQATDRPAMPTQPPSLGELDDPALIAYWAAVRNQLALTPSSSPKHPEIKRCYDAAASEYRRRMHGEPGNRPPAI